MKTRILVVLSIALVANCHSVHAEDTPAQAAALTALEQKMHELDHSQAQPPSETNSLVTPAQPAESATNVTNAASDTAAARRTAPARMNPAVAPVTKVPATAASTKAASVSTAPADAAFAQKIPAANDSAQAAALTALNQKMRELNRPEDQPVTETPTAEAPVAISPVIAPSAAAPLSAARAVSIAPAAAAPGMSKSGLALRAATLPFSSQVQTRPANQLVTTTGAMYKSVEVERVELEGIVISYTSVNGGWATVKIPFQELPPEIRQQFGK